MKKGGKKILIIVIVIVVIGAIVLLNMNKKKEKPLAVQTEKVKRQTIVQTVNASGSLQPVSQVKISANVSARIINIAVKEGQTVKKGDLLVELDRTQYEAAYEKAISSVQSAKANRNKVASELKRIKALYERNLAPEADREAAEAQMELAESQVVQAEAALKQALDDLDKTRITAPMAGIITSVKKEVGEIALGSVFQEDVILVVSDMSKVQVEVDVDETDVVNVAIGDTALIELDAIPNAKFKGVVSEIAHSATTTGAGTQEQVTNFLVKIAVIGQDARFRPGMSATVDIITDVKENAIAIPIQALTARPPVEKPTPGAESQDRKSEKSQISAPAGVPFGQIKTEEVVFVVKSPVGDTTKTNKPFKGSTGAIAEQRTVKIGISSDTHFEILEGLDEGEEIVIGPYKVISKDIKDGSPLKITNKIE
ncbi:MAG TPA: efflux RND transporter periplasmic adaptor subunit [Candidatus Marinimicrobia bacterium]|nr:efflux RND transporter periplasmic adaptor subunit [Candidatus Neomarinimicrobiota bacterium]